MQERMVSTVPKSARTLARREDAKFRWFPIGVSVVALVVTVVALVAVFLMG